MKYGSFMKCSVENVADCFGASYLSRVWNIEILINNFGGFIVFQLLNCLNDALHSGISNNN